MSRDEASLVAVATIGVDDATALAEMRALLRDYEESLPRALRHAEMETELQELSLRYADGAMLLARVNGEPVGCVLLQRRGAEIAAVRHLYVAPVARRSGVGRALMDALIAAARSGGFTRVVLDTHRETLTSAYALYRALGFVECAPHGEVDYACPTFMELRLGSST